MIPFKQRRMAQQIMETFTRQHYIAIAKLVKELKDDVDRQEQAHIANFADALASLFKQDNPNFDKSRFLQACGF